MVAVSVTEFKARCLEMLSNVPAEGLAITKRGEPIAVVLPSRKNMSDLIGIAPDVGAVDPDDDLFSTGERWDAES